MTPALVLFDLDGTLVDSVRALYTSAVLHSQKWVWSLKRIMILRGVSDLTVEDL
ncbi:MAG: hypothetical protein IPF79_06180 [Ignavibacteria bacterium]|nr:hypothetical protein [Ignavibacteria bacterium]